MRSIGARLDRLEHMTNLADEGAGARVIVYDPRTGPPELPDDVRLRVLIPDNGRGPAPVLRPLQAGGGN